MPELKGSKTEANLQAAFAGESQARNKYTYLRGRRKKKGLKKSPRFFSKRLKTRRNTRKYGSNCFKTVICLPQRKT